MADVKIDKTVLTQMIASTPAEIERFLDMEAETMVNNVKLSFGTSPPGRTYTRGTVVHIASSPRYPPNVDTGFLRSGIHWEKRGKFTRWIMDGALYGIYLEQGTTTIAPRPFMVPEVMRAYTRLADDMRNAGIFAP